MKITPALPSPQQPPAHQDRKGVTAVSAVHHTRTAGDQAQRQQAPARRLDQTVSEQLAARLERQPAAVQARRALNAYQQVAAVDQRSDLRELLGFDAYA